MSDKLLLVTFWSLLVVLGVLAAFTVNTLHENAYRTLTTPAAHIRVEYQPCIQE